MSCRHAAKVRELSVNNRLPTAALGRTDAHGGLTPRRSPWAIRSDRRPNGNVRLSGKLARGNSGSQLLRVFVHDRGLLLQAFDHLLGDVGLP